MAGGLVLAALVGGALIGSALAQEDDGTDAELGTYCETFLDTFATELDASRDDLVAAAKTAANAALDAAVQSGDLSEERAAALRDRIEGYDGTGCDVAGLLRHGSDHGPGAGVGGGGGGGIGLGAVRDAAADALGIDAADLGRRLRDAGSLEALAAEAGVAYDGLRAAILADVEADVEAAVADDGLSRERADRKIERLTTWLEEGGELRGPGHGQGRAEGDD